MQIEFQLNELNSVVEQVWKQNSKFKIWTFNASMGSGKTTFINALCKFLKVDEVSSSPTFSIINEYQSKIVGTIFHLDLFRLKDEQEVLDVGVEDVLNSNNYCFIEWPSKAKFLLPDEYCQIQIEFIDDGKRRIIF
jgi:tRNA threonylcarbamoyladenosine biosynthesis protein TsaE